MGTTVLIDGDTATVEPDTADVAEVAALLLEAADDPADVHTVTTRKGTGFRVPAALVPALALTEREETGLEGAQTTRPPEAGLDGDGGEFGGPIDAPSDTVPGEAADAERDRLQTEAKPIPAAPPKGNAPRAEWAEWLDAHEVRYPADANRDELRDLWKAHQAA